MPCTEFSIQVFLLYTHLASAGAQDGSTTFIGLGSVNTHQDTLSVQLSLSPNKNREEPSAELTHACDTQSTKKHHHHHHVDYSIKHLKDATLMTSKKKLLILTPGKGKHKQKVFGDTKQLTIMFAFENHTG